MSLMDLSKNNTDRKAYEYELVELKEQMLGASGDARDKLVKRMKYIRRKIRECTDKRGQEGGYRSKKVGVIGTHSILESKMSGTVIMDSIQKRGRYGKPINLSFSRALTYEEHQELLRQKREKKDKKA